MGGARVSNIRVLSDYKNGDRAYSAGDIIDPAREEAEYLMRDSPGSFEEIPGPDDEGHDEDGPGDVTGDTGEATETPGGYTEAPTPEETSPEVTEKAAKKK